MQIFRIIDEPGAKLFIKVPLSIYKDDPTWIRPLDKDINEVFDEKKNKAFRFGKIERWILKDDKGNQKLVSELIKASKYRYSLYELLVNSSNQKAHLALLVCY